MSFGPLPSSELKDSVHVRPEAAAGDQTHAACHRATGSRAIRRKGRLVEAGVEGGSKVACLRAAPRPDLEAPGIGLHSSIPALVNASAVVISSPSRV